MNTMTKKLVSGTRMTAKLLDGTYGYARPGIELRFPPAMADRMRSAALHSLAAEAEVASQPTDTWTVEISDVHHDVGYVRLEGDGSPEEVRRGLSLLRRLIA